jgi:hypothetical protein
VTRARLGAIAVVALSSAIVLGAGSASGQTGPDLDARQVVVFDVPGVSFEELLSIPEVAALARAGGGGLLANPEDAVVVLPPDEMGRGPGDPVRFVRLDPREVGGPAGVGREIRGHLEGLPASEVLVIAFSSERSPAMAAAKDELPGAVVAVGDPASLLDAEGDGGALTSASTRRDGVVVGGDLPATIDAFLGGRLPVSGSPPPGEPIEVVEGPPPFELHERYLAQRTLSVPVGTGAALYVTAAGIAGVGCLAARRRIPVGWPRVAAWACLSIPMLATGMLAAGHLPQLSYATAVPMIAIVAVLGTMAFSPLERRDVTLVPAGIGVAVLALFVVEWLVGWTGLLTPLLGGSQLDGGRFFGVPNVALGLLVGSALWVAQRLRTGAGFAVLCGLGLFAGLPMVGANLGGAVTAFVAAGLWVAVRERGRLGVWRGIGVVIGTTLLGTGVVLVAHAISPVVTHVTRFEEDVEGIAGVLETFVDRLQIGFDLIARNPAALVPVLGLPVVLFVVLRPPPVLRRTFEASPAWRDAVLVTVLAGIVAYVVNDTGPAAAGLAFGLALGGMLGVSLLSLDGKMGER